MKQLESETKKVLLEVPSQIKLLGKNFKKICVRTTWKTTKQCWEKFKKN